MSKEGQQSERILRMPKVVDRTGYCRSSVYNLINEGLFPKSVVNGKRTVGWPESEVTAVIAARIASKSEEQIRVLVKHLTAKRAGASEAIEKAANA